MDLGRLYRAVHDRVVGRERETQLILAALDAGRDLLLEGPPGTSKSTILRAICAAEGLAFHLVEGNADLTPTKLVGHHSPAQVMAEGYSPESFVEGPLPRAMREGGVLYLEELNRIPEDTLNTLIGAMAERELTIPRVGTVRAAGGFRVISAMNPFDNVGTARLSGALTDRLCRVRMGYQSEAEERAIVARRTGRTEDDALVRLAVGVARATRAHADLRMGASVRAAIDFTLVAARMQAFAASGEGPWASGAPDEALVAAARVAFSIKVLVRESVRRTDDEIVEEIVRELLDAAGPAGGGPGGEAGAGGGGAAADGAAEREAAEAAADPEARRAHLLRHAPGAARRHVARTAFSPADAPGVAGRLFEGDEAARSAAGRPRGDRRFHRVAAEHPELGRALAGVGAAADDLLAAIDRDGGDPLEVLGKLLDLGDRRDLRELARRVAVEVVIDAARRDAAGRSARGRLVSRPFRGEGLELDLDRTLDRLLETPAPRDEDFVVRERRRHDRSYALVLDLSGSMKGEKAFFAALAAASLLVRVQDGPVAVVAFWRDAAVLKHLHEPLALEVLLARLLALSGWGLTNLALGLEAALGELAGARTEGRVGLLFSDGLHTAGDPPGPIAAAFSTLHVIGIGDGDESHARCRELAAVGHGRAAFVSHPREIASALTRCLSG